MVLLAMKTTSYDENNDSVSLYIALIRRLALLRHTAFPNLLLATKAARPFWPCCFSFRSTIRVISVVAILFPLLKMREISAFDLMISKTNLHGKAFAALSATTRENCTTALCGHASTEAVALRTLASIRLIGAFHGTAFQTLI